MVRKLLQNSLIICFLLFFCVILFFLIFRVPTAIFLLYIVFALFITTRLKNKQFLIFLILGAFLIRFAYINIIHTPLESDFKILYDSAVLFSKGDYSFNHEMYFQNWGYQIGFVIFEGTIIRLFGQPDSIFILKTLNCLWSTGIVLLIYLIARNHFKEKSARFAALLYMGLVFSVTFVSVLSNQHISAFFLLSGVFLLIDTRMLRTKLAYRAAFAGIFMAVGNILRPEGLIIVISLSAYFLILLLKASNKEKLKIVFGALILFGIYIIANSLFSRVMIDNRINESGLKNNNVYWKFVEGLNLDTNGLYSTKDAQLVFGNNLTKEEQEKLELSLIRERLSAGFFKIGNLFLVKMQALWCDNAMYWSYNYLLTSGTAVNIMGTSVYFSGIDKIIEDIQGMFVFTLLALCIFGVFKSKKISVDDPLFLYIAVPLFSTLIYLFIEVQARYVYLPEIFLFILAGAGLDAIVSSSENSGLISSLKGFFKGILSPKSLP